MNDNEFLSNGIFKLLGCLALDIALVLGYFKIFGLFLVILPFKSILVLFVLLVSLLAINSAILFPISLFKKIGVPYSAASITLIVLYAVACNVFSMFLIGASAIAYISWQLIIFSIFIISLAVLIRFSKSHYESVIANEVEANEKTSIKLQLIEIEQILSEYNDRENAQSCIKSFKILKDRIKASTPFGRIRWNMDVLQLENQIKSNLNELTIGLQKNVNDEDLARLDKLISDTNKLVVNREVLNIK